MQKTAFGEATYGEWELGTYQGCWRVVQGGKILCASHDIVDAIDDLGRVLDRINIGRFTGLRQLTGLDVRVECENDIAVDFLAAISSEDECFHIFCPDKRYVEFSVRGGWKVGVSDKPWKG